MDSYQSNVATTNASTQVLASIGTGTGSEGKLHTITIGSDAGGGTVTVRDGGASGAIVFQTTVPANGQALCAVLDIQLVNGLRITTSGFTAPLVVTTYR